MRTDTTHIHLLLQSIREDQLHQGSLLEDIAERQEEGLRLLRGIFKQLRERAAKPVKKPVLHLPPGAVLTSIHYLTTLWLTIYLLRDGVEVDKLAPLLKAFGLP